MSLLDLKRIKLGDNADLSKNFIISVPTVEDGTLTIEREDGVGILTVDVAGVVTFPNNPVPVSLGVGQTWQNVKASRVSGTEYTNNTDKPILLCVSSTDTGGGSITVIVGGVTVATKTSTYAGIITVLVPSGSTYKVTTATSAISTWTELR